MMVVSVAVSLLCGMIIGYMIGERGASAVNMRASEPSPAAHSAIDWNSVTNRDLDMASVFLKARDESVEAALQRLDSLAGADVHIGMWSHPLAHAIGRMIISDAGRDPAVFSSCAALFQAGCFHGVIEGYFLMGGSLAGESLDSLCTMLMHGTENGVTAKACNHGMGHGLIIYHAGDWKKALKSCEGFRDSRAQRNCYDGVFMQRAVEKAGRIVNAGDGAPMPPVSVHERHGQTHEVDIDRDDCHGLTVKHAPSCWTYKAAAFLREQPNAHDALRECNGAPSPAAIEACYQSFGKTLIGMAPSESPMIIEVCASGRKDMRAACVRGGAQYYTERRWTVDQAAAFCSKVPASEKAECFKYVGDRAILIAGESLAVKVCKSVKRPHMADCLLGARRQDFH
jgi:hypothetical protein